MSADDRDEAAAADRVGRLELDLADLRAENARLKGSIAQREEEIVLLGERLAGLQRRLAPVRRAAAWMRLRRLTEILHRLR